MSGLRYPRDIYGALEEWTGRPLDWEFIDWFSELPGKQLYDWYMRLMELPGEGLPLLKPGTVRPFVSTPYYSPNPKLATASDEWETWSHQGTCMLLLCDQVAITEPLIGALAHDLSTDPPRGQFGTVRRALRVLHRLRELVDRKIVYWVHATAFPGVLLESKEYLELEETRFWHLDRSELLEALMEVQACRMNGRMNPVIQGRFKGRDLRQLQRFLGQDGHAATFTDLCSLDIPAMTLTAAQLIGLRTTAESFASLRKDLSEALARLPARIRDDPAWQESASDFMADALRPSYETVQHELHRSSTLRAARIAGQSIVFSVAGMEVGTAVGGAATWATSASSATVAALSAAGDFVATRRKRAAQKEHLRVLREFTGKEALL